MKTTLYPLLFSPLCKEHLWGGDRIPRKYGRPVAGRVCAESWEIADRPEGMSVARNGPLSGHTLHDLVVSAGAEVVGSEFRGSAFPLLVKLIDARQRLSLQVHPDEESARRVGGEPKTEMWYVLEAAAGAYVYAGTVPGVTCPSFLAALEAGRIEETLRRVPVSRGHVVYVPGGRVHALGEGCLVLEAQQNSDTTYRLYDWERRDRTGKTRPLHVKKALEAIRWDDPSPVEAEVRRQKTSAGNVRHLLISVPAFCVERLSVSRPETVALDGRRCHILFLSQGGVRVETESSPVALSAGDTCLVPAALPGYVLTPVSGDAEVIRIRQGDSGSPPAGS